jgi:hypothetical protein
MSEDIQRSSILDSEEWKRITAPAHVWTEQEKDDYVNMILRSYKMKERQNMSEHTPHIPIVSDEMIMPPALAKRPESEFSPMIREAMLRSWQNIRDFYEDRIDDGTLIRADELTTLLDSEIALAEENLVIAKANASMGAFKGEVIMETMLATYKAVRAKYGTP